MYKAKSSLFFLSILISSTLFSQDLNLKLTAAWKKLQQDPAMRAAATSIYIEDAATGKVVFAANENLGMAPASTQKIFTSVAGFHYLGADYRYQTRLALYQTEGKNILELLPSWDPSLGSERFGAGAHSELMTRLVAAVQKAGVKNIDGIQIKSTADWNNIPEGWTWQDLGQYYGAAPWPLNWHENQYDLLLNAPGGEGKPVEIAGTQPALHDLTVTSQLTTGPKNSGDNSYIFYEPGRSSLVITGTIPEREKEFRVSGSIPDPHREFISSFREALTQAGISTKPDASPAKLTGPGQTLITIESKPFFELNEAFMKKSINLYGEAFLRTIGSKAVPGLRSNAVSLMRKFYDSTGIDSVFLGIRDGSGLSPENRVTTKAEVKALKYARSQPWFPVFYQALPLYNGMHMKSGTISQVKGFAGYHKASNGKEYVFSILMNNFQGSSSAMVQKMYAVLDLLK